MLLQPFCFCLTKDVYDRYDELQKLFPHLGRRDRFCRCPLLGGLHEYPQYKVGIIHLPPVLYLVRQTFPHEGIEPGRRDRHSKQPRNDWAVRHHSGRVFGGVRKLLLCGALIR